MGILDWSGIIAAWAVAAALGIAFYGRGALPRRPLGLHALAAALLFASAVMAGHMLARVGDATLAAKPWLYFMMTGGLALTFIGPAVVIGAVRRDLPLSQALHDWAYWLAAYLGMGAAFWLTAQV